MSKLTKPDYTDVWSSAGSKTAPSSLKIQTGWVGEKPPYEYWNWMMNRSDVGSAYSFQMGITEWDSTVEYQYSATYKSYVQRNGLVYKALQTGTNKNPLTQPTYWGLAFDDYGLAATVQTNLGSHITNYNAQALRLIANGIDANLGVTNHLPNINVDAFLIPEGYFDGSTLGDKPFSFGLCKTWKEDNTVVYQFAQSSVNGDFATRMYRDSLGYWTAWKYYANISGSSTQLFSAANGTTGYEVVNKSQLDTKAPTAGNAAQEFAVAAATTGNSAVNLTQLLGYVSSGMVLPFAGSAAPTGWLECNGGAVSRTTYAALFAVIGTLWGIGDGSTTFNLPETRGEFIRGYDNSRGVDSGRALGSWQADELEAHTHDYFLWSPGGGGYSDGMANDGTTDNRPAAPTTSTGGSETRPRNVAMMYIIKI